MTQFVFTAGAIYLRDGTNGNTIEPNVSTVKQFIAVLQSMGQTWKCASQTGDALERLLDKLRHDARSQGASTNAELHTAHRANNTLDVAKLLQRNPDVSRQLQHLGWNPPGTDVVPPTLSDFNPDLESLLTAPTYAVSRTDIFAVMGN